MNKVCALLLAAGRSVRFGKQADKLQMDLGGMPVWMHSAKQFNDHPHIEWIGIVVQPRTVSIWKKRVASARLSKVHAVIPGGSERWESSLKGLNALPKTAEIVAIHDAARPFISKDLITLLLDECRKHQAIVPCLPLADTVKVINSENSVERTLDRKSLIAVQTPQVFSVSLLKEAYSRNISMLNQATDDAMVVEMFGKPVYGAQGEPANIKITTPYDLEAAQLIMRKKTEKNAAENANSPINESTPISVEIRSGIGYDIHRLSPIRKLVLGGIPIEFPFGLMGHSDADVLVHAICDALLGAGGLGDIGRHFPDNDPQYKDISSLVLLKKVSELLNEAGWSIVNIDATVIAEAPKLSGYFPQMISALAETLQIEQTRINIKATTHEKLGSVGRQEGISAMAVAALRSRKGA